MIEGKHINERKEKISKSLERILNLRNKGITSGEEYDSLMKNITLNHESCINYVGKIKEPVPQIEKVLCRSPHYALRYALITKQRFYEAEEAIFSDKECRKIYCDKIIGSKILKGNIFFHIFSVMKIQYIYVHLFEINPFNWEYAIKFEKDEKTREEENKIVEDFIQILEKMFDLKNQLYIKGLGIVVRWHSPNNYIKITYS